MHSVKYEEVLDGEWIEPKPQKGHKMACCDCGLVHIINFRVRKGKVQFQPFRDDPATKRRRKKLNISYDKSK